MMGYIKAIRVTKNLFNMILFIVTYLHINKKYSVPKKVGYPTLYKIPQKVGHYDYLLFTPLKCYSGVFFIFLQSNYIQLHPYSTDHLCVVVKEKEQDL